MNCKIYLDPKEDKEQRCQLFFVIYANNKRAKIFSGVKVQPQNWNNGIIRKREFNGDLKQAILNTKFGILNSIITEAKLNMLLLDPSEIKETYLARIKKKEQKKTVSGKTGLLEFIDHYIVKYTDIHKPSTLRTFKQVKSKIRDFDKSITMEDINHDWMMRYCGFLVSENLEDSTIKFRHIKSIKVMAHEAKRIGIPVSDQVDLFKWKAVPKQPFYAEWKEVEDIQDITDFVFPIQEKVRDLFLLSCYTGLRHSDLKRIKPENLYKQGDQLVLRVIVTKTDFDYSIPIGNS